MATKFTALDDEKLIDLVEERKMLYDVTNEAYKNAQLRKDAWIKIGNELQKPGEYIVFLSMRQ